MGRKNPTFLKKIIKNKMINEINKINQSLGKLLINAANCNNNISAIMEQRRRIRDLRKSLKNLNEAYMEEVKAIRIQRSLNRED